MAVFKYEFEKTRGLKLMCTIFDRSADWQFPLRALVNCSDLKPHLLKIGEVQTVTKIQLQQGTQHIRLVLPINETSVVDSTCELMHYIEHHPIPTKETGRYAREWLVKNIDDQNYTVEDICHQFHVYWELAMFLRFDPFTDLLAWRMAKTIGPLGMEELKNQITNYPNHRDTDSLKEYL